MTERIRNSGEATPEGIAHAKEVERAAKEREEKRRKDAEDNIKEWDEWVRKEKERSLERAWIAKWRDEWVRQDMQKTVASYPPTKGERSRQRWLKRKQEKEARRKWENEDQAADFVMFLEKVKDFNEKADEQTRCEQMMEVVAVDAEAESETDRQCDDYAGEDQTSEMLFQFWMTQRAEEVRRYAEVEGLTERHAAQELSEERKLLNCLISEAMAKAHELMSHALAMMDDKRDIKVN